ncbi:sigma-70 family RNA polymerase sigma factor [Paenibacillus sp. IB182496]|uniref:Sigma-70 family RNA polymerase sigma factor n=1 Tax=Paenibacillus sabuli TaxID=2772509 RepID=A0A927BPG4_9BACL|nr:sigma-70 family RNA polymerase sigma factor [Paenibacillus sabuli]
MDRYGDRLLRTAALLLGDRQAAEEAVQDTFVQAYRKIGQLQHPARLAGWLGAIVVSRCRMRRRAWSWNRLLPMPQVEPDSGGAGAPPGPEALLLRAERSAELLEAIGRLGYRYREVVTLYYYQELGVEEIAHQLRTRPGTVKSRLARARTQLRHVLEREEASGDARIE